MKLYFPSPWFCFFADLNLFWNFHTFFLLLFTEAMFSGVDQYIFLGMVFTALFFIHYLLPVNTYEGRYFNLGFAPLSGWEFVLGSCFILSLVCANASCIDKRIPLCLTRLRHSVIVSFCIGFCESCTVDKNQFNHQKIKAIAIQCCNVDLYGFLLNVIFASGVSHMLLLTISTIIYTDTRLLVFMLTTLLSEATGFAFRQMPKWFS